jgi:two-component system CheB/CheR fusion protein
MPGHGEKRSKRRAGGVSSQRSRPSAQIGGSPAVPQWVVGVGASAGGLEAFSELLQNLPTNTGMAFVLVQHLDPRHESILPDLLQGWTPMPVIQVHDQIPVEADHVYVIPPNATMVMANGSLKVSTPEEPLSHLRRPIDTFFASLSAAMSTRAIGVVLSGAASDGTLGLKAIKAEGGITFSQDETAKFDGMPRSAITAGFVDFVLPPKRIALEIAMIARHPFTTHRVKDLEEGSATLDQIIKLVGRATGVDFGQYKPGTVRRRLARRMVVQKTKTLETYLQRLKEEPREVQALFDDFLIKVTEFFRDPEVFEVLKTKAIPAMLKGRIEGEPLRVWVPGCSSGEEVYSIAICILEYLEEAGRSVPVQIFGTDVSEAVIERARFGVYGDGTVDGVSPERLRRFFSRHDSGFQINRTVRDLCIFSTHNLGKDPPLSHMDLVSCRNVLIYLAPALQHKVVDTLAYALRPLGCLMVGPSENTARLAELFDPLDQEHRIYCRKASLGIRSLDFITSIVGHPEPTVFAAPGSKEDPEPSKPALIDGFAEHVLVSRYGPSGVLVDKELRVVEWRGDAAPFSRSVKTAGRDLGELVHPDLAAHLSTAIQEAHRRQSAIRLHDMRMRGGAFQFVRVSVIPIAIPGGDAYSIILFEDLGESTTGGQPAAPSPSSPLDAQLPQDAKSQVEQLQQELASSREYLRSIIEELRSTIEEAQSANEELQSSNEELQTTKEELQASNEELSTMNAEMQSRNAQLGLINDDLKNLLSSISTPIVMVGNDLRIRRFTPAAEKVLHLISTDAGRPISDLKPRIDVPDLDDIIKRVLDTLKTHEQEVRDSDGRDYMMRVQPYRTEDNRIEGAVVVLFDITELNRSVAEARRTRDFSNAVVDTVREPLLVLDDKLNVARANQSFYNSFRCAPTETEGRNLFAILGRQLDLPVIRDLMARVFKPGEDLHVLEIERDFFTLGRRTLLVSARGIGGSTGATGSILLAFQDITEQKRAMEARYRRLFESARDGIIIVDATNGEIADINPATQALWGFSREDLLGRVLWEVEPVRENRGLRSTLEQMRDQGFLRVPDLEVRTKDGRVIQTEMVGNVYAEGGRTALQLNLRDLTDRRKFERELQHSQKLESLGLLAGGVAHDFNNLLTGILGNASLLYSDLQADAASQTHLRGIIAAAERAADLTRQLLAHAGKGRALAQPIELSGFIREILPLIQTSIPKQVELRLDLAPDLPALEADPAQIQQLAMNLVINGAEAIPAGSPGWVEIRTASRRLSAEEIREQFASEGLSAQTYVVLQIRDSGSGMDEATKARIFDPFFTTKFTGRGLGLAAVSGIVRTLGGVIRVYSAPGEGSTFYVALPAAAAARQHHRAVGPEKRLVGSGTVLVIDDDDSVRSVARSMLERSGFAVLEAGNGQAGVDLFRSHNQLIVLVLLDMTMPGISGEQTFDELRAIRSDVPVLLASGYDEVEADARAAGRDFAGFLHKPFDVDRMASAISQALARGRK